MSAALDWALFYESDDAAAASPEGRPPSAKDVDIALVERARQGDFAAFEELVRRYRNDVFGLAFHFVRNREDAWDVSQEVFIKAHRSLGQFRGDASFKTWLMRITANQCKDVLKRGHLDTVAFDDTQEAEFAHSPVQSPDQSAESKELGEAILKALETLPYKHRTAFVLREFEGVSYEEMSRVMGCTIGTVMSRLFHARRKLQASLVRMGIVGE